MPVLQIITKSLNKHSTPVYKFFVYFDSLGLGCRTDPFLEQSLGLLVVDKGVYVLGYRTAPPFPTRVAMLIDNSLSSLGSPQFKQIPAPIFPLPQQSLPILTNFLFVTVNLSLFFSE